MKNINKLFMVGVCLLAFTPCLVKADIASPGRSSISAYVSNTNGAELCNDFQGDDCFTIPYGTKITIEEVSGSEYYILYDDTYYYIDSSDCTFSETDKFTFKTLKATYHTMAETKVYKMPFFNSDVVGTISKDNDIKLMEDSDKKFDDWKYVKYGDVSGWVYVIGTVKEYYDDVQIDSTIVLKESGKIFIALPNAPIYTDYQAKNKVDIVLNYGDIYEYDYKYDLYYNPLVRIKVGDNYYWTVQTDQGYESGIRIYNLKNSTKNSFTLYKNAYDKTNSVTKTINDTTVFNTIYTTNTFVRDYDCWALIEIDGEKLWALITMDDNNDFDIMYNYHFTFNGERKLYSDVDLKNEIGTLTVGSYYGSFLFEHDPECIYIDGKGFVPYYNSDGKADDITYSLDDEDIYEDEDVTEVDVPITNNDKEDDEYKMNAVGYIVIGVSFAIFAGVIILIINKKKNKKNKSESVIEIKEAVAESTNTSNVDNDGVDDEKDNSSLNE